MGEHFAKIGNIYEWYQTKENFQLTYDCSVYDLEISKILNTWSQKVYENPARYQTTRNCNPKSNV